MKSILSALYTIAFLISIIFLFSNKKENINYEEGYPEEAEEGNGKDRNDYMFNMLRDPASNSIPTNIRQLELDFVATLPADMDYSRSSESTFPNTYWNVRGPLNVGGMTRVLAMDVTNPNILLAGTNSGGIWRSTNGGLDWKETFPKDKYDGATCIVQDKRAGHSNTWYAGSGDFSASASASGKAFYMGTGIKKSIDGGITWKLITPISASSSSLINFDSSFDLTYNIAMRNANNDSTLFAACYAAVMKSIDGGKKWKVLVGKDINVALTKPPYSFYSDVVVTPNGVVYATLSSDGLSQTGIWRSDDGVKFVNITPSLIGTKYDRIKIGYAPSDENQVYFLIANTPNLGMPDTNYIGDVNWKMLVKYNYINGDGDSTGGRWTDLSNNLPTTGGPFDKLDLQGSYNMLIKVHPTDTNIVFLGGTNLYKSTTGFRDNSHTSYMGGYQKNTQLPVVNSYENHHSDQHELLFHPTKPNVIYNANDGGVFRCDDLNASTTVWTPLTKGYLTTMFYTVALEHTIAGDNTVIGGLQDNGTRFTNSANPNYPWVHPNGGDGSYCAIADNKNAYYFSLQKGKIRKCKVDNSGNVTSFSRIEPIGGKDYLFINPFVIDPISNNQMYLPEGKRIWRNDDLAGIPMNNKWDSISTNWSLLTDTLSFDGTVTAIAISKKPANTLYYGTDDKKVYKVINANAQSTKAIDITPSLANASSYVSCIAIHPYDANKVMVTYSNYKIYSIFYTEDGGATWKKVAGNLEQFSSGSGNGPSIRWAQIVPYNKDTTAFFVATSTGLFATTNLKTDKDSTIWVQQGINDIGNAVCTMIDYRAVDGQMVVATHSRGVFSARIDKNYFLGIKRNEILNQSTVKVYPNPIQSSAIIEYTLPINSKVSIVISDALGKQIKIFDEGLKEEGKHQFYFQRNNILSGLYYCTLQLGRKSITKTLLIE